MRARPFIPSSLRDAFLLWAGDHRHRIGTLRDLGLYRLDLSPTKAVTAAKLGRFMDKDATMEIMKYFGMKRPGLFIKHTIKRPSNTGRRK